MAERSRENYYVLADASEMLAHLSNDIRLLAAAAMDAQATLNVSVDRLADITGQLDLFEVLDGLKIAADVVSETWYGHAKARAELEVAEAEYDQERVEFEVRWSTDTSVDRTDPRTGKTNVKWSQTLLEQAMAQDKVIKSCQENWNDAKWALETAQADLEAAKARFSALRSRARLIAAALMFLAGPMDRLGALARTGKEE